MKVFVVLCCITLAQSGCTPVKAVGNAAVGAGQLALGAVDVVL